MRAERLASRVTGVALLAVASGCADLVGVDQWEGRAGTGGADAGAGPGAGAPAGATGGTGAGGAGDGEDCQNGQDDDGDGEIDCADDACGDYSCVPEVPGIVHVALADASGCPPGTTLRTFSRCDGCACDKEPGTCVASVTLSDEGTCSTNTDVQSGANCFGQSYFPMQSATVWAKGTIDVGRPASCAPADHSNLVAVCEVRSPSACGGAEVCVPHQATCVFVPEGSCPPSYPTATFVYAGDQSVCGCGCTPEAQPCSTFFDAFDGLASCSGNQAVIPGDGGCYDTALAVVYTLSVAPSDVTCAIRTSPTAPSALCCR